MKKELFQKLIEVLVFLQLTRNTPLARYTPRGMLSTRSIHFHLASSSSRSYFCFELEFDGFSGRLSIDRVLRLHARSHPQDTESDVKEAGSISAIPLARSLNDLRAIQKFRLSSAPSISGLENGCDQISRTYW